MYACVLVGRLLASMPTNIRSSRNCVCVARKTRAFIWAHSVSWERQTSVRHRVWRMCVCVCMCARVRTSPQTSHRTHKSEACFIRQFENCLFTPLVWWDADSNPAPAPTMPNSTKWIGGNEKEEEEEENAIYPYTLLTGKSFSLVCFTESTDHFLCVLTEHVRVLFLLYVLFKAISKFFPSFWLQFSSPPFDIPFCACSAPTSYFHILLSTFIWFFGECIVHSYHFLSLLFSFSLSLLFSLSPPLFRSLPLALQHNFRPGALHTNT